MASSNKKRREFTIPSRENTTNFAREPQKVDVLDR